MVALFTIRDRDNKEKSFGNERVKLMSSIFRLVKFEIPMVHTS